jgi:hypothetical protein
MRLLVVLYLSTITPSPIYHPSSTIHHPPSNIQHPTSNIQHLSTDFKMPEFLSQCAQQQKEAHRQARGDAIAGVNRLHRLITELSQAHIHNTQYNALGVKCKSFPLGNISDDQMTSAPNDCTFFLPRTVPSLDLTNPEHQRQAKYLVECWDGDNQAGRSTDLGSQTANLWSRLGRTYVNFPRQEEPPRPDEHQRSLRQIAQWIPR